MMTEQYRAATGARLLAIFITGTRTIDAVYANAGIEVFHVALLPNYGGIGDHRYFLLDVCLASVIRNTHPRVIPGTSRKLDCNCACI